MIAGGVESKTGKYNCGEIRHSDLNVYAKPFLIKNIAAKGKLNNFGSNNNLSMGDIYGSIISNSSNGMLNPRAEFFSLVSTL